MTNDIPEEAAAPPPETPEEVALGRVMEDGDILEILEDSIRALGASLLRAGAEDLARYTPRLSGLLLYAQASGNDAMLKSIPRQVRMLGEAQRLRATDAQWSAFTTAVEQASSMAVRIATSLLLKGAIAVAP